MDEVRRNNIVKIMLSDKSFIEGAVIDYIADRIMVLLNYDDVEASKKLKELDKINVTIHTPLGIKTMKSHVITGTDSKGYIIIENVPSARISQRREFVRIEHQFPFNITTSNNELIKCNCSNLSAGGIAFYADKNNINLNEKVTVLFPSNLFEKDITCQAKIIKIGKDYRYIAKFNSLNPYDEDKIVKYVFKLMTRNVE